MRSSSLISGGGFDILVLWLFFVFGSNHALQRSSSSSSSPSSKFRCKKSLLDKCSQKLLMITDRSFQYPTTIEEMGKRCKEMKLLDKCINRYSQKCLPINSIQRQSFSLLIYGVSKTNKAICRNQKRRRAFAEFGKSCANRLQEQLNDLVDDMNHALFKILEYPHKKLRVPLSCCNYYQFQNNVMEMYNKECPEHAMEMDRLLKGFTRDSLTFLCGGYRNHSEKCAKVMLKMADVLDETETWITTSFDETASTPVAPFRSPSELPSANIRAKSSALISTYVEMLDSFTE